MCIPRRSIMKFVNDKIEMNILGRDVVIYGLHFSDDNEHLLFNFDYSGEPDKKIEDEIGTKIGNLLVSALEQFVEEHKSVKHD
jgi:hypothetical protein